MSRTWTGDELDKIGNAEEIALAPVRKYGHSFGSTARITSEEARAAILQLAPREED